MSSSFTKFGPAKGPKTTDELDMQILSEYLKFKQFSLTMDGKLFVHAPDKAEQKPVHPKTPTRCFISEDGEKRWLNEQDFLDLARQKYSNTGRKFSL